MAGVIRLVIVALICAGMITGINKSVKIQKKRKWRIWCVVFCMLTLIGLGLWNFENYFVTFPTAKAAYFYQNIGVKNIIATVDGEESTMIIERNGASHYTNSWFPKGDGGWKMGSGFDSERVGFYHYSSICIVVDRYKGTDDYYLTIYKDDIYNSELEISDERGTVFHSYTERSTENDIGDQSTYWACITGFDKSYKITINGETFSVIEDTKDMF